MDGGEQLRVWLGGHRDHKGRGYPTLARQRQEVTESPQLMQAMLLQPKPGHSSMGQPWMQAAH